jgi:hypothetical protein
MAIKRLPPFNPKSFLAKVGEGRRIGSYDKEQIIFFTGRSCSDGRARKFGFNFVPATHAILM